MLNLSQLWKRILCLICCREWLLVMVSVTRLLTRIPLSILNTIMDCIPSSKFHFFLSFTIPTSFFCLLYSLYFLVSHCFRRDWDQLLSACCNGNEHRCNFAQNGMSSEKCFNMVCNQKLIYWTKWFPFVTVFFPFVLALRGNQSKALNTPSISGSGIHCDVWAPISKCHNVFQW